MSDRLVELFTAVKFGVVAIADRHGEHPVDQRVVGSGFNVDPTGIVVTAFHVVEPFIRSQRLPVAVFCLGLRPDGRLYFSYVPLVYGRRVDDLDVIVCRTLNTAATVLPTLSVAAREDVTEGTSIATCGYPLGLALEEESRNLSSTFQRGIVACVLPYPTSELKYRSMYTLDMTVNRGNSGGPVFVEDDGTVIAIIHTTTRDMDSVKDSRETSAGLYYKLPAGLANAIPVKSQLLETVEFVRKLPLGQAVRAASDLGESFEAKASKFAPSVPIPPLAT